MMADQEMLTSSAMEQAKGLQKALDDVRLSIKRSDDPLNVDGWVFSWSASPFSSDTSFLSSLEANLTS
jgi:hypothetical protein